MVKKEKRKDRDGVCSGVPRGGLGCSSTPISLLLNAASGLRKNVYMYAIQ